MGFRAAWSALWRGAPEAKVSRAGPVIAFATGGPVAYTPRNYDGYAKEGFQRNVIAYRAITEVARGVASVPWTLFQTGGDEPQPIEDHPLLDLWRKPNPMQGRSEFVEAVMAYWLISGNSYIEAVAPGAENVMPAPGRPPNELWTQRPDRMKIVKSETAMPAGYIYEAGGRKVAWEADPVTGDSAIRHLKFFNPLDDWYGQSPIEAAAYDIDQHTASSKWNLGAMQNGLRPTGFLTYEPKTGVDRLDGDQFQALQAQLAEQSGQAVERNRPMLLEGGLKWQEASLSPKDMDWLNGKHTSARDIALAFGVPPQLLGIPGDNTYSNYQEARLALWEETIVPHLQHLTDEMNGWLAPMFGDGLIFVANLDDVPALIPRREKRWDMTMNAVDKGVISPDEARERIGYEPRGGAADQLYQSATQVPITGEPAEEEDEGDDKSAREDAKLAYGPTPRLVDASR